MPQTKIIRSATPVKTLFLTLNAGQDLPADIGVYPLINKTV
jgi:hypothetical protein